MEKQYFYSPSTKGFYVTPPNRLMPDDVVPITEAEHSALLNGPIIGSDVVFDVGLGKPKLVQRVEVVEHFVSPYQLRQALNVRGYRGQVEQFINTSDQETKDAWDYSLSFRSRHPRIVAMGQSLGLDQAGVDELFTFAATLEP